MTKTISQTSSFAAAAKDVSSPAAMGFCPDMRKPTMEKPTMEKPTMEKPTMEKPTLIAAPLVEKPTAVVNVLVASTPG